MVTLLIGFAECCFKVRTKRTSEWMPVFRTIQRSQGAQFAPRRIARKPITSFAHHSEATAPQLQKIDDLRLVDGQLRAYPATPEPGTQERLRVPRLNALINGSGVFVMVQKPTLCIDERSDPCKQDFAQATGLIILA
jgi:hypothetical protein